MADSCLSFVKATTLSAMLGPSMALYYLCQKSSGKGCFPSSVPQTDGPSRNTNSAGVLCK